ncbi:hypothetical protein PLESTB_001091700 [Pleodorina starrii]|uniref:K Homology domain-containing protein n=1 Tax=Pleodorina starrii TaxID=330485 RepID=A0A9W6BRR2_9CHLO|nr:hypothetical protein PLESTM_000694700 [Pleodorina starrii]GLC56316.1 hypothetical protein PLESTB_001091700 [Pleodorina starrii]GLC69660.1 hypothetical protein PLESTF_000860100 [Pleodorina starrii]
MTETDVLHCRLVTVGSRTYRVQGSSTSTLPHQPDQGEHAAGARWQQDDEEVEVMAAGTIDESLIQQEGGQFVARLSCDPEVYPFIIGREGRTRKQIEAETGAQLNIPRKAPGPAAGGGGGGGGGGSGGGGGGGGGGGDIVIRGPTRAAVSSGYVRTQLAVHNAVTGRLLDYNFFISLPLASPAAVRQFEAFRRAVLTDPRVAPPGSGSGLEESIFMRPQHLHLTLVMLKLYSDQKRHEAQQLLARLRGPVAALLGEAPLKVHLQGLEYMNDDPAAMHVLYLKVQDMGPGNRLEALCDLVVDDFAKAGLLLPQDERKVKLHATVINTRYRKRSPQGAGGGGGGAAAGPAGGGGGPMGRREERQPFDGRALLQEHGRLDLGIHTLEALHLSKRGVYGEDGYYRCVRKLELVPTATGETAEAEEEGA